MTISHLQERTRAFVMSRWGVLLPLLVLLPITVGYNVFQGIPDVSSGATVQKIIVLIVGAVAAVLLGFARGPWPVLALLGVFAVAFVVALIVDPRGTGPFDMVLFRGVAGYVLPWLAFFINWRAIPVPHRALSFALMPLVAVLLGGIFQLIGVADFFMHEYTGALRLAAGMPPAYLAALALFGVVGAVWLWVSGHSAGLVLAIGNMAVCALTGTRGATLATGLILFGGLVIAICFRLPKWRLGAVLGAVGLLGAVAVMLPTFIQRSLSSVHGLFGFSGRTDAWAYFLERFWQRPLSGYGPGGATALSQESGNRTIERSFVSPHSAYVSLLVDLGLPLFIIAVGALVALVVLVARSVQPPTRWLVVVAAMACVFYGAFDNLLNAPQSAIPFAAFLAMAHRRGSDEESEPAPPVVSRGGSL